MRPKQTLLACTLLVAACDAGPEPDFDAADTADTAEPADDSQFDELAAPLNPETTIGWTSDGRAAAVRTRDHSPLFHHQPEVDAVRGALEIWLAAHAEDLGHASASLDESLTELELDRRVAMPTPDGRELVIHRFTQRYRGYRVSGPGQTLAVSSIDGDVLSVQGALVDNRVELTGRQNPASREAAALALAALAPDTQLLDLELVALPERQQLGWRAEVEAPTGAREWLTLSSDTRELLIRREASQFSSFDHHVVRTTAQALTADPDTSATMSTGWLPGSTWSSWNPWTGWDLRMGDDRALVFDSDFSNATTDVPLTAQFYPGTQIIRAHFDDTPGSDPDRFHTQTMFHRLSLALDEIDLDMTAFGWEHYLGLPLTVFDPAPLNLLTNVERNGSPNLCQGAEAYFTPCTLSGPNVQVPYDGDQVSCIYDCDQRPETLMHELGHYIDRHATLGSMGGSVNSGTCIQNTPDEAIALAETIGDITGLVLLDRLYPLDYTLSGTTTPCTFESLNQGTFSVHDSSCLTAPGVTIGQFGLDRPANNPIAPCNDASGRRMRSVNQAIWAWINNKSCNATAPFTCYSTFGIDDLILPGLIYSLSLSNAQSYQTLFENIEDYIWVYDGPARANAFRAHMQKYGIL